MSESTANIRQMERIECNDDALENKIDELRQNLANANNNNSERDSIAKFECKWQNLDVDLEKIQNEEKLIVLDCPSIEAAISKLKVFVEKYYTKIKTSVSLHIKINESNLALNEYNQYFFILEFNCLQKSFLILLESSEDNSSVLYWRLKDSKEILKLSIESSFGELVHDFIFNALKNNSNGLCNAIRIPQGRLTFETTLDILSDAKDSNLLFYASETGNSEAILKLTDPFDINQAFNELYAIDLAYIAGHFDTVVTLLLMNSRFPQEFQENSKEFPIALRKFIVTSKNMHDAIEFGHEDRVTHILAMNSGLKYFFNLKNQSALAFALEKRSFGVYKILLQKGIKFGPHENFQDIIHTYTSRERKKLSDFNHENFPNLTKSYILKLLGNSNVGPDDELKETRCAHVLKALECLNKIKEVKILLKFTATMENFQLIFDFNRDHVQFLDPKSEAYCTGLFYLSGRIYIGAKYLLDRERAHEVYGVIAHEICHFVMFKTFGNYAKPYAANDTKNSRTFERISQFCEVLNDFDEIISLVYECYDEDQQHAELIVRIPHLLANYHNNPDMLEKVKRILSELYWYYMNHCFEKIQTKMNQDKPLQNKEESFTIGVDEHDLSTLEETMINEEQINQAPETKASNQTFKGQESQNTKENLTLNIESFDIIQSKSYREALSKFFGIKRNGNSTTEKGFKESIEKTIRKIYSSHWTVNCMLILFVASSYYYIDDNVIKDESLREPIFYLSVIFLYAIILLLFLKIKSFLEEKYREITEKSGGTKIFLKLSTPWIFSYMVFELNFILAISFELESNFEIEKKLEYIIERSTRDALKQLEILGIIWIFFILTTLAARLGARLLIACYKSFPLRAYGFVLMSTFLFVAFLIFAARSEIQMEIYIVLIIALLVLIFFLRRNSMKNVIAWLILTLLSLLFAIIFFKHFFIKTGVILLEQIWNSGAILCLLTILSLFVGQLIVYMRRQQIQKSWFATSTIVFVLFRGTAILHLFYINNSITISTIRPIRYHIYGFYFLIFLALVQFLIRFRGIFKFCKDLRNESEMNRE